MVRILVGGDICPIGGNAPFFRSGDAGALFHDLLPEFREADLVVANLECPLIASRSPIGKTGPVFGAPGDCINGVREAGIDALCLANNHILDHGPQGLASTLAVCAKAGIATVGAGANLAAARQVLVQTAGSVRIGIIAMAEHEFSIAGAARAGANPLDLIGYVRSVAAIRPSVDYLLVLLHGGLEFLTSPSPRLKETCHFLIEMGANAVIVQHPHSFGGYETYLGGHIVYGQGALVMDEAVYRKRKSFHHGILVALEIDGVTSSMKLIPFVQSDPVPGARRMDKPAVEALLSELAAKARAIEKDEYVSEEWARLCNDRKHGYLNVLLGHNRLLSRANRHGRLARLLYGKRRLLSAKNLVSCESHREAIETIVDGGLLQGGN
jgi:poly-gamma-glutamate synthesis protein (capsule biosynthesis protein)